MWQQCLRNICLLTIWKEQLRYRPPCLKVSRAQCHPLFHHMQEVIKNKPSFVIGIELLWRQKPSLHKMYVKCFCCGLAWVTSKTMDGRGAYSLNCRLPPGRRQESLASVLGSSHFIYVYINSMGSHMSDVESRRATYFKTVATLCLFKKD